MVAAWNEIFYIIQTPEQARYILKMLKTAKKELFPSKFKVDVSEVHKDVSNLINEYRNVYLTETQGSKVLTKISKEIVRKARAAGVWAKAEKKSNTAFNIYSDEDVIELGIKTYATGTVISYYVPFRNNGLELFPLTKAHALIQKAVQMLKTANPVNKKINEP
jgi:hypothetical protein